MIDTATLVAFALAALAIVLSPGPDTMLILRHTLASGRGVGFAALAGVQLGLLGHTLLAALGLSALIASSPTAFHLLAVIGAAYLAWLGLQAWRSGQVSALPAAAAAVRPLRACREAVLCNLLNPKVILLFLALYPNFVDMRRGDALQQIALLSTVLVGINVAWQAGLVLMADAARRRLLHPVVQLRIAQATGAVFLFFAAALLWEHAL